MMCLGVCFLESNFFFLKNIFIDYAITVVPFFSPFSPPPPCPLPTSIPHPQFMSTYCVYIFFGFSISYTILNLSLSILYLPFMLLISCTFSPIPPPPLPADNPPCDLHFFDSVPVLVVCLVYFCFCSLGSVVDTAEFVVI